MQFTIDVSSVAKLEEFFKGMAYKDRRSLMLKSFRRAAKPILSAAKTLVPRRTGKLARSLGSDGVQGEISLEVGALRKKGGYHAHLVESGTVERAYRKNGKVHRTGKITPTHFFENAYNMSEEAATDAIENEWFSAIMESIRQTNARLKR